MESQFELKVKDAIKPIDEICEKLVSCTKSQLDKGINEIDSHELGEVLDGIKDMCESKEKIVKALYYTTIGSAMEENVDNYGETWDENGYKKYYNKGNESIMPMLYEPRDIDLQNGRMYYTQRTNRSTSGSGVANTSRGTNGRMSRYGYSHDKYMDEKGKYSITDPEDIKKRKDMLSERLDDLYQMAKEEVMDMTPEEKNMWRTKIQSLMNL